MSSTLTGRLDCQETATHYRALIKANIAKLGFSPGLGLILGCDDAGCVTYHRFMLDEIAKVIPNLDKSRSIIAGFSNGAHAIDGMLRLSGRPKLTDYFGIFLFADGGGTGYTSLGALPDLKGKFAYACWGGEKGSNKPNTSHLPKALKAKGATVVGSEMAGVGHAFAPSEHMKIAEWLEKVALASPAKK